jgi:holin-like protein
MRGFAILLGFQLLGTFLERVLHIPLPGNVIGLILCLCALWLGLLKLEWIEQTSALLLKHMMLFFAPVIAGTIVFIPLIRNEWPSIVATLFVSTMVVVGVTGWFAQRWTHPRQEQEQL